MQQGSPSLLDVLQQAAVLHDQGRILDAERLYQRALAEEPRHFGALYRFGVLRLQQRKFDDAAALFRRAVKADKKSADAHQLLGFALTGLKLPQDAVQSYEKAISIRPAFPEAHNNLGYALQTLGQIDKAIAHYSKALKLWPEYAEASNNMGNALHLLNRSAEAVEHYERALVIQPDYAEARWNLATAFRALGRFEDAITHYQEAIAINPNYNEAYNGLGNTLRALGLYEQAIAQYEKALAIAPNYHIARINVGDVLHAQGHPQDALTEYDRVLTVNKDDADALSKKGVALNGLKRYGEALICFERALAVNTEQQDAFDGLLHAAAAACDWRLTERLSHEIQARVRKRKFVDAFGFLGYSDDPSLQLKCAETYIAQKVPVSPKPLAAGVPWRNQKIRVAYLSHGFHRHPTAYLTAELFEIHDRSRFEIIGVSTGPDDRSEIRARLIKAFDQFHDVRARSDDDVAKLIHDLRVDIVIDRSGYTTNARPEILARRPAPIQVNYIGFPGTLGAEFYDYIIADQTVLPFDQQRYYAEKIVHLPDSYLVNDSKRPSAVGAPTRASAGLPDHCFVFCSFNDSYKITPQMFDIWMRLLARVEGSVLWLLRGNSAAEENLRREAAARGIDPDRLVFAGWVSLEDHLARHQLADLFLDSLPYNAHTTASDALWAGLPIVTCIGRSSAGRVAASLLKAIGTPDLITTTLEDYEALALRLATEPPLLDEFRATLRRNRLIAPLFDSQRYRRNIEAAYIQMWERWQHGERPRAFTVEPAAAIP
jgi:protein O-GlcNAc transferase